MLEPSILRQDESTGRFLGWKFAAAAHQNTSRWVRTTSSAKSAQVQNTPSAHTNTAKPSPRLSSSASPFSYAGFASTAKLPTGFLPTAVVQGDFNGDGKMDLAISNGGDDTIYVYLGNGDGTFGVPEVLYTTGQAPVWLAAAKLRTTGHLDLITVDGDSGQVEVFFGNGDGTFQPSSIVGTVDQIPTFVLADDFNNDGKIDIAVGLVVDADSTEPQFEVLQGDGNGNFPSIVFPPSIENSSDSPLPTSWLAAGDINNDGIPDVVTTVAFSGAIAYLNQGGTAFAQGGIFGPNDSPLAIALADMNGDGCLDAVETGGEGYLTIAKGNCDGTFTQGNPAAELGDFDVAVAVADVNGDGKLDVVASSAFSDAEIAFDGDGAYGGYLVSVLEGDGTGNVAPAALYRVGSEAYSLLVTDLSGNNFPDIVTMSQVESNASLLVNDGSGGYGSPAGETIGYLSGVVNAPLPGVIPQTVDVNGDGKPDVVLIESGQVAAIPHQLAVLLNDGRGKLGPPILSPITVDPNADFPIFVAASFRSATNPDVIYISQYDTGDVDFIPGNGDGTFGVATTLGKVPFPYEVASGDFNGDGKLDFAVFGYASADSFSTWELDVFLGNGDGTFKHLQPQTFSALTTDHPQQLIAGDFNHDGKLDLLIGSNTNSGWVNSGDDLDLVLGNGDGTFQTPTTLMAHFGPVAVADLNGDGYLDLIQTRDPDDNVTQDALTANGGAFITPAVTIYLGGPSGTFTKKATYSAPGIGIPSYYSALVGDFNGDGNLDIALPYFEATIGRPWERRLQMLQGNGDGTFAASGIPYQLPAYDLPIVGGDYRGVGATDLLDLVGVSSAINTISASPAPPLMIVPDSPLSGNQGSATVSLALPAASVQTVQLSSSDSAVSLPGSVAISEGQTQQSINFTLGSAFDSTHLLAISANLGGQTATAYFAKANSNIQPGVTAIIGGTTLGTSSAATSPGGSIPLIFTLQSVAGYSGEFSQFGCAGLPAGASCNFAQSSLTLLPGGYAQVAFDLTTTSSTPGGMFNLTISANNGEISPSVPLSLVVSGFSVSGTAVSVAPGATTGNTSTITVTPVGGFTGSVALTAAITSSPVGASNLPTMSFGSASAVSITGSSAGTATLTISTTAPTSSALTYPTHSSVPWYASGGVTLACIVLFGVTSRRRTWLTTIGLVFFGIVVVTSTAACGGGGGNGGGGGRGTGNPGTTAGLYTVTVTATSGSTVETGAITITVQ